ncbi:MAG: carbohydrate binding family 9 domain-containing protein [Candidatus Krumholzibacteriota bacterium]|nr:carbohydrate binding family 9 domain-containing protein [Candidatus Krumholzibacteriota bacterium]
MKHGTVLVTIVSVLLSASAGGARADEARGEWKPVYHPRLEIRRAAGAIAVDGVLGDAGWRGAARADGFAEHNPGDQTRPAVDTEVWIAYDDENLYVAWLCHDDPEAVRGYFCERDDIFSGDYVILCIDTYGEATHAYEIATNPYGIPGDLLFSSASGEDITYDMIFESAARVTADGWGAEMAIPFESLRFPRRQEQTWRVDFWRNRPRECRYQYSWAAYDRDMDCWPCNWGTMTGIRGVEQGGGIDLLPAVIAYQSGSLGEDGEFRNDDVDGDLSLGISYDVSSELIAEATINPDFSQVESDADQIDVNSTFALFYPEKRPFFQEGGDLFDTYLSAVYTRSINDPSVAGKLTWRGGSSSLALLSAYDEHSVIILPFEEESRFLENGKSVSNILRYRRDLGEQAHVGLVATDRRFDGGGSGSLVGLDAQLRLSPSDKIEMQALVSHTGEVDNLALADSAFNTTFFDGGEHTAGLDGETFTGHALNVEIERNAGDYWAGIDYTELSPTFRADNGFEPSNNYRKIDTNLGGILRFAETSIIENVNGNVNAVRKWNFDGVKKDEWIMASGEIYFRAAQTGMHSYYMRSNELFRGIPFDDIWQAHTCFSTKPSGRLHFGANINYGHRIARRELVMGKETSYGGWADIRPIDRMLVSLSYSRLFSDDLDSGERLFSQSVFRSTVSLQFSREFSVRLVTQYNDRGETWDVDPLLTYRINSLTVFYVGSTHTYRDLALDLDGREGWTLADRQFFLKLQYLFRI